MAYGTVNVPGKSYSNATQSADGLMSPADKSKLDGLAHGSVSSGNTGYVTGGEVFTELSTKADASALNGKLDKTGGTMSGALAMGSNKITGLADAVDANDLVNKGQMDAAIAEGGGGTTIVFAPTVTVGTYTYDGTPQGPTIGSYDSDQILVANATQTNAGTYLLTLTLKNKQKMVWNDLTTIDKTFEYTIGKATPTFSLSANAVTLNASGRTAAVTLTYNGDGAVSVSTSDDSVATGSFSNGVVTVASVDNGKRSRAEICEAWTKYDKAGGQHVKGLLDRRKAELALFKSSSTSVSSSSADSYSGRTVTSKAVAEAAGLKDYVCSGDDVRYVQSLLKKLGYDIGASGVDGECGDKTASAIGKFQSEHNLKVDKMAGKKTVAALATAKKVTEPVKSAKDNTIQEKPSAAKHAATKHVNYLALSAKWMKVVYPRIVLIHCKHAGGSTSYKDICTKKKTTCSTSVSAVLQQAGILKKGKKIGHTKKDGHGGKTKTTYKKAIYGTEYLIPGTYDIVKVGKKYSEMSSELKKPGIVYVQDSNICMCAGGGYIYSTNQGTIQYKHGHYVKDKVKTGYPFRSKILYAIVPRS